MKKILIFAINLLVCIGFANAAVRDGTTLTRQQTQKNSSVMTPRTTTKRASVSRTTKQTVSRSNTPAQKNSETKSRAATNRTKTPQSGQRKTSSIVARNTTNTQSSMSETRTGAEYEQCKNTYFACMDQFCAIKNDDYRRCSCSERVYDLIDFRQTLQQANDQLTVFTENLEVVGMTAAQAAAMRNETEGEQALTDGTLASKSLLQAIMNSIRGDNSEVSGKYSSLNSVNISFDSVNAFGMTDVGQAIASYNGIGLYNAVYPQCRNAVRADCNNASLQRAITAYLMAIEQDCNTVQAAFENTQQKLKKSVREGSAMLDLARVENRQKHNSSDITTCINEVEAAILSEEVCGANYHKCLDSGEFIDITTGAPITGVKDFYKLETMLVFSDGVEAANQKLAKNPVNRQFVTNFENRVKKFAADALDKCVENADFVWSEYLDKAMLAIYYSQKDKVSEIKQNCFHYISSCYADTTSALNNAASGINSTNSVGLQPDKITLNQEICSDYIQSCNNMFNDNIITAYVENIKDTDLETACRAVAKQCFDRYGGTNYENFYYPYSGLFEQGKAWDWFTLKKSGTENEYVSECAKQLSKISACQDENLIEKVFGGFDLKDDSYGYNEKKYELRPSGVATEVYNQVMSILSTQCMNVYGRFVEPKFINTKAYKTDQPCISQFRNDNSPYKNLAPFYGIADKENMCPQNYELSVDTKSWGACLCWENGGRRSKWGKSAKCVAALPTAIIKTITETYLSEDETYEVTTKEAYANDASCDNSIHTTTSTSADFSENSWCIASGEYMTKTNRVCPLNSKNCAICPSSDDIIYNDMCYPRKKAEYDYEYDFYNGQYYMCTGGAKLFFKPGPECRICKDGETLSETGEYCLFCPKGSTQSEKNKAQCLSCPDGSELDENQTYCIKDDGKRVSHPLVNNAIVSNANGGTLISIDAKEDAKELDKDALLVIPEAIQ